MTPLTDSRVALELRESNDLLPTRVNVDLVKEGVELRRFIPLNSVVNLRESARNVLIPGKIDYVLPDGTTVALDVSTNVAINNKIKEDGLFEQVLPQVRTCEDFLRLFKNLLNR